MKYTPGHYCVLLFCPLGTKLGTYWIHQDRENRYADSYMGAQDYGEALMADSDTAGSFVVQRVIYNSAAPDPLA